MQMFRLDLAVRAPLVQQQLPIPYEVSRYGAASGQVAITFDDGPDPRWTAPILDVLKAEHVSAAFFMVGSQAVRYQALARRAHDEGHEIGNHTWSHPDFSAVPKQRVQVELNMAERLFVTKFGFKTSLFRSPYAVSDIPDTTNQVLPMDIAEKLGYISVANNIDPHDWIPFPKPSAEQITASIISQLPKGNIVLLHDGGGDRQETVRALPMIIHELRARGYQIVPLCQLLGKSAAEVMPTIPRNKPWLTRLDSFGFHFYAIVYAASVLIFFFGNSLMCMRLLSVGTLAALHRFRPRAISAASPDFKPPVAVLVPAYNEEKVIVGTVRTLLDADYHSLHVIVIDDGSTDRTLSTVRAAFAGNQRVTVLTKPNGGKASALNYGLQHVRQDIFFGIDADTQIDPKAIALMVAHFADAKVAAVAGTAKVGNCMNLWTRWQALEYLTSQNLERRALDFFGAITVVPGAIGAWRTAAVV
jgi:peptidoglycan/xylan/chitin deacetylase (PgdA/CDA1 family)